ncbi:hypothetical protein F7P69_15545 [Cellulosimicrobium funkei]|nr:hypothetical protein [Cellulosimicrobium funkei]
MDSEILSPVWLGGAALWLLGASFWLLAFGRLITANLHGEIPQLWGRPEHFPRGVYLYRIIGILALFAAFSLWSEIMGMWALLLFLAATVPVAFVNTSHNRRVRRRRTPSPV